MMDYIKAEYAIQTFTWKRKTMGNDLIRAKR
jgi:hypothetical protein